MLTYLADPLFALIDLALDRPPVSVALASVLGLAAWILIIK